MARTIIFKGDPLSTQHIYGRASRGFVYMTAEGKAAKRAYQWETKAQWKGAPLAGPVNLSVSFFFKNHRKRDLDNQNKLILDALNGIAYNDDSQIDQLHLYRQCDPENPRIEIVVKAIGAV